MKPLAIVQARIGSTRLLGKMLLPLGGRPLVYWAWKAACDAFGRENVVAAIPASEENDELASTIEDWKGAVFRWDGPENDVLGRLHACAQRYRWHPDAVIVRITPDDPFKVPDLMRRVAEGERHPVELGGEAFTLAMLNRERERAFIGYYMAEPVWRETEHLSYLIGEAPPPPPGQVWTIDTRADYEAAVRIFAGEPA